MSRRKFEKCKCGGIHDESIDICNSINCENTCNISPVMEIISYSISLSVDSRLCSKFKANLIDDKLTFMFKSSEIEKIKESSDKISFIIYRFEINTD